MCDLCSAVPNERKQAVEQTKALANRLRDFANSLDSLAFGTEQPHSPYAEKMILKARIIIRELVVDWL